MDVTVDEYHVNEDMELVKALHKTTIGTMATNTSTAATLAADTWGPERVDELDKLHEKIARATFDAISDAALNELERFMLLGAVCTSLSTTFANEVEHLEFLADLESLD